MVADALPPKSKAVKNWRLLEDEIVNALRQHNWHVGKNALGDPCVFPTENKNRELNIAELAQALSSSVLVKVTVISQALD